MPESSPKCSQGRVRSTNPHLASVVDNSLNPFYSERRPVPCSGYGREYADPYLGHGIGPVTGYGTAVYRSGYNRFAPY
ncbi:jg9981 [Pararge aegeria aegeria]|uniref:Jg9981 protein n=1 Tax=Pararge aegeria aegeria TaxID=348720 RepID=A0A8S4S7A7_9NEOP|nr:jg9981 [Pararge aegeria aegeria]